MTERKTTVEGTATDITINMLNSISFQLIKSKFVFVTFTVYAFSAIGFIMCVTRLSNVCGSKRSNEDWDYRLREIKLILWKCETTKATEGWRWEKFMNWMSSNSDTL